MVKKNQKSKSFYLYIEGGGDQAELHDKLRRGFSKFFDGAGCRGKMPRIVACGGREQTFDRFQTAVFAGEEAILLVDSEELVSETCKSAWEHFQIREGDKHWTKPEGASDDDAHLMVCCMESWFLADRDTLKKYFGQGFNENALPHVNNPIESNTKNNVIDGLKSATRNCKTKIVYNKGEHSFALIGLIDPKKVEKASTWAEKLLDKLRGID